MAHSTDRRQRVANILVDPNLIGDFLAEKMDHDTKLAKIISEAITELEVIKSVWGSETFDSIYNGERCLAIIKHLTNQRSTDTQKSLTKIMAIAIQGLCHEH